MKKSFKYKEVKQMSSIREMLDTARKEASDKTAFEYKDEKDKDKIIKVSYKEFIDDTIYLGTALYKYNLLDKHVAIIGENSYKWITVYITMLQGNGVFVPIDKELTIDGVINVLKHSESEVLFYSKKYEDWIEKISEELPNIKYFIGLFNDEKDCKGKILSYDEFIKEGKKEYKNGNNKFCNLKADSNELRMLVYTSGTTGNPKGVMLSEHNVLSVANYGLMVADIGERCLSVLPYHHTYEAVAGIITELFKHSCICINDSLKNVLKNLNLFKPDFIYLVPAFVEVFYKNIWANAKKSKKDIILKIMIKLSNFLRIFKIDIREKLFKSIYDGLGGNLRIIICGGAPLRPEIGKFFDDIGISLLNGYGITECSPLVSVNNKSFNDSKTVGIILPCCEVKLENVNAEGDGEVCVKGDIVMMGYYKDKEKTDRVLKDGWFNTEDYGHVNDKGQLIINGRKKNLIVLDNGKNVYPEEIENYILKVPYIQEAIVKSKKNEQGQETALIAEVFLNEDKVKELGTDDINKKLKLDIRDVCKALAYYKRISEIEIRKEEFVKTTTNKIKR